MLPLSTSKSEAELYFKLSLLDLKIAKTEAASVEDITEPIRKLSRSEINNYNRQKINDARDKMNVKYSDADYVCSPEDELIIEQARQRIAEKYGDTYEN